MWRSFSVALINVPFAMFPRHMCRYYLLNFKISDAGKRAGDRHPYRSEPAAGTITVDSIFRNKQVPEW